MPFITKRLPLAIPALLLSLGALGQVAFPVPAPASQAGEVASFRTVNLWNNSLARTSRTELVEVQPEQFVVLASSSVNPDPRPLYFTRQWQPCRSLQGSDKTVCAGALKFPMNVGDRYNYEKLPWINGQGYSGAACAVAAQERITVAAGPFDTVRIECEGFWNRVFGGTFSGRQKEVLWYAPSIGRVVQFEFVNYDSGGKLDTRERTELTEFVIKGR